MTVLWFNLVLVFLFSLFARYFASPVFAAGDTLSIRPNKFFVFVAMLSLISVSGLRSNIGDTYFYKHAFQVNDFTWGTILAEKDIGFGMLQMVLKYFSADPQILIFTTALITNVIIISVFYRYSRMVELTLYVYITGGLFLVSMNGIRQVLAAAIAFIAIKYVLEGHFIKYAVVVIIAALFHQSALILLPIYFLARRQAWSKVSIGLIVLSAAIVIGVDKFSALLFSALEQTQYAHYKGFAEGGANGLRVAVIGVPLAIAYIGRNKLRAIFPGSDPIVNMAMIGFFFMIVSTQNWIFARISIYFELYHLILIGWIVKVFRDRDQKLVYFGILVCYFLYYYYENVLSLNIVYHSDYLKW